MIRFISFRPVLMALAFTTTARLLHGETVTIRPGPDDGKDVSLYERTDTPLSSGPSLYVINTGPPGPGFDDFKSLVEFDLSDVAALGAEVTSARLWLYENNVSTFSFQHVSAEFPNVVTATPAATAWAEDAVFFSTLPDPVAGYTATRTVDAVDKWFSWDVTAAVRDWLDGALDNHGFLIASQIEVRDGLVVVGSAFASSEQNNAPFLEIEIMNELSGDYDRNGVVDGADFLVWQREFGTTAAAADGNGDGTVGDADLALWRDDFGQAAAPASTVGRPIPEPAAAALLVVASAVVTATRFARAAGRAKLAAAAAVALAWGCLSASPAVSASIPFTEDFAVDGANWRDSASAAVAYIPGGGVGGAADGYISAQRTFTANPTSAQTVFRAHDGFDSSGDLFVGDWLAAGVTRFSFWIRHNAPAELTFGTRFAASANSPGANGIGVPNATPPNVWKRIEILISPAHVVPEGPPTLFSVVFGVVGNLQISARPGNNLGMPITFDLDRVSVVPEPSCWMLLACGGLACGTLVAMKRRRVSRRRFDRRAAVAAAAALGLWTTPNQAICEAAETGAQPQATLTPLPEPLASLGAASHRDWLYVYGGHAGETHDHSQDNVRGDFRRQPLSGGAWETLPGGPAVQSPTLVAHGDFLYRIGGLTALNPPEETSDLRSIDSVERYHPDVQQWESLPNLPEPRSSHDAVVVGDQLFVAGGWSHSGAEGEGEWLDSAWTLDLSVDPQQMSWKRLATAPFKRRALALAACGGRVYCIGGLTPDAEFSRRVDVYDPRSGEWSRGPDLPESERNGFGASAFEINGRLYVSSLSEELLALAADGLGWTRVTSLNVPRYFHRLVPGDGGSVLLVGGASREGHLASIVHVLPRTRLPSAVSARQR